MKHHTVSLAVLAGPVSAFTAPRPSFAAPRSACSALFARTDPPILDELCDTTGVTLTRFLLEVAKLNPELSELTTLFGGIDTACKALSNAVKRSALPTSESTLDVIANDVLKASMRFTGKLGVLTSEEEDTADGVMPLNAKTQEILIDEGDRYVAVFDPLDGSSNVDAGIPTGTVIGIYEHDESCEIGDDYFGEDSTEQEAQCLANTLQPGDNMVGACYCLYSSSTFFVLTLGNGVHVFTLDENIGEFVLSKPNVRIPEDSYVMSFNDANSHMWDEPLRRIIGGWREGTGRSGQRFTSRYIGSMVADVHRTLLYGGVFGYPADSDNPTGKLRLLYEAAPISFIVEQAGGLATTGTERVMDISPEIVHQRIPIILGSKNDVQEVIDAYS